MSASNEITREQALATIDKEMHKAPKFRNNSNIAAAHDRYCETPTPYWHDSSKDGKLSYANVCWKAQGKKVSLLVVRIVTGNRDNADRSVDHDIQRHVDVRRACSGDEGQMDSSRKGIT